MVELAIQDVPEFALTDIEIRRSGKSYSIDTVRALQQEYGPGTTLFFMIGLDAFLDLPSWKNAQTLLCKLPVCGVFPTFRQLSNLVVDPSLSCRSRRTVGRTRCRPARAGRCDPCARAKTLTLLRLPPCDVSASDIRQRMQEGRPLANLLPPPVESYILREGLYREDSDRTLNQRPKLSRWPAPSWIRRPPMS